MVKAKTKALKSKMLATGKIEREGDNYRATVNTKSGTHEGVSRHRPLALTAALYESKRTKKNQHPVGGSINLMK